MFKFRIQFALTTFLVAIASLSSPGMLTAPPTTALSGTATSIPYEIAAERIDELNTYDPLNELFETHIHDYQSLIDRIEDKEQQSLALYNLGVFVTTRITHDNDTDNLDFYSEELFELAVQSLQDADLRSSNHLVQKQSRQTIAYLRYFKAHRNTALLNDPQHISTIDFDQLLKQLQFSEQLLTQAASAYRSVFDITHDNETAKDVHRVRLEIQELRDQMSQIQDAQEQHNEEQQRQQQQQQNAADQLKELAQEQQRQAQHSKQKQNEQNEPCTESLSEQEQLSQDTAETEEELKKQERSPDQQTQQDQVNKHIENARESQRKAEQSLADGKPNEASEHQQDAAESLKKAADTMQELADQSKDKTKNSQPQSDDQEYDQQQSQNDQTDEASESDSDQIDEVAKQLLDKERREREARQAYRAKGKPTKVERDW